MVLVAGGGVPGGARGLGPGVVERALGADGGRRFLGLVVAAAAGSGKAEAELGGAEVVGVDLHGREGEKGCWVVFLGRGRERKGMN